MDANVTSLSNTPTDQDGKVSKQKNLRTSTYVTQDMIAESAYYLAEQRGFAPGYEVQDWVEAELIITRRFAPV